MMTGSSVRLSSLYTSGQCLLSVLGSVGVILLFAGIPQLIYASHVSAGSLLTFLLGAFLITLMVTGNAFIGYKYRQLIRDRRERDSRSNSFARVEDKPPSYDDLLKQEELPPSYAAVTEKPPRYEDYINEVYNWEVNCTPDSTCRQSAPQPRPCTDGDFLSPETPIIVPLHKHMRGQRIQRQNAVETIPEEGTSQSPQEVKVQIEDCGYSNPSYTQGSPIQSKNRSLNQTERRNLFFNPSFENQTFEEAPPEYSPPNGADPDQPVPVSSPSSSNAPKDNNSSPPDSSSKNKDPLGHCESQLPEEDSLPDPCHSHS